MKAKDTLRQPCDKSRQKEQSGSDCSFLISLPQHAGARKCTGIVKAKYVFQSLSYMDFETGGFPLKSGDLSLICLIRFFTSGASDTVLVFVCLGKFHFHAVEDDIALFRILVGNEAGHIKFRMIVSVPSAGNILIFGDTVAVRSHRGVPGRSAGSSPGSSAGGAGR